MSVFFTSDTHFGHKNIIVFEKENRPFQDVSDMDWVLIKNWNSIVDSDDVVIHLGDAAMGDINHTIGLMSKLNGHKILVPGNHDSVFSGNKPDYVQKWMPLYRTVFAEIWPEEYDFSLSNGTEVTLSHFPYDKDERHEDRYAAFQPTDRNLPLLHGHVHSTWAINGRQYNVGVDVHGLKPVSELEIISWVDSL